VYRKGCWRKLKDEATVRLANDKIRSIERHWHETAEQGAGPGPTIRADPDDGPLADGTEGSVDFEPRLSGSGVRAA
jgi:hypothetical protein